MILSSFFIGMEDDRAKKMACIRCSLCIPLCRTLFPVDGKAGIDAKTL